MKALHYSGPVCYDTARSTTHILGGYAACCSGERTIKLRNDGMCRREQNQVTCKRCLAIIAKRVECRAHPRRVGMPTPLIVGAVYECGGGEGLRRLELVEPNLLHYSLLIDIETDTWRKLSGTYRSQVERSFTEGTIITHWPTERAKRMAAEKRWIESSKDPFPDTLSAELQDLLDNPMKLAAVPHVARIELGLGLALTEIKRLKAIVQDFEDQRRFGH